ncbi:unnamed protein product [Toxocara canis]|uniref:Uncharacterized protein n=1 Tax=Toxocara canis TaxID=6265 RepID=A0A3P7F4T0_TOXCA|nr:unnamed protein product [Toxocara canis]
MEQELIPRKAIPITAAAKEMSENRAENMKQLLASFSQKQSGQLSSLPPDEQICTPLEQQFVDLARISTAKDTIIEQQRCDIKSINEKLDLKAKELKEALDDLSKCEKRCNAQEEELNILRNLSKEQTYMCEKVNELTRRLLDEDQMATAQKSQIDDLVKRLAKCEAEKEASLAENAQLSTDIETAKATIGVLESRLEKLSPLAELRQITVCTNMIMYYSVQFGEISHDLPKFDSIQI